MRSWYPLAALFAVVGVIVVVLAMTGAVGGVMDSLYAAAALLAGLGTVFVLLVRRRD